MSDCLRLKREITKVILLLATDDEKLARLRAMSCSDQMRELYNTIPDVDDTIELICCALR